MDFTEYTAVKRQFIATPNLCDLFKLLSIETWKRIEYAYIKPRIKVYETTITQNLLFSINAYNDMYGLNIEILEATNERSNGNDIELVIKYPLQGKEFYAPIQAKKIYRNGLYTSMEHGNQIESLRIYASTKVPRATAFYLLYNYVPGTGIDVLNGCTLVSADFLYSNYYNNRVNRNGALRWTIPGFSDLNPTPSFQWHKLVCPMDYKVLLRDFQLQKIIPIDKEYGFFNIGTFSNDLTNWVEVNKLQVNEKTTAFLSENSLPSILSDSENNSIEFSPKSRIIITVSNDNVNNNI